MDNIDNRIVNIQFNNKDFEKNAATTLETCEKLDKSLTFKGVIEGLSNLGSVSKSFDMSPVVSAVETVTKSFSPLEEMAIGALRRIGDQAMQTGEQILSALTIDQVQAGYGKFDEKTQSVQTIMSATGKSIEEVNEQLEILNWYTDETSYAYTDMTNNIGRFTNAGVKLEDAVTAMIGIGNAAGLAGANVQDASHAMAGMAKAMGQGYMDMMTWNWIQTAHMDTVQFKQSLIDAGVAAGKLTKLSNGMYSVGGKTDDDHVLSVSNFDRTLSKSKWLTSDIMVNALNKYGATTNKIYKYVKDRDFQIATSDAIEEMGISMEELGMKAFKASQEAKTFSDAIEAVKDAVSTGWMKSFELVVGNYEQAKKLWTDFANWLYDIFAESGNSRNELLKKWQEEWTFGTKELHGRAYLLEAVYEICKTISEYIEQVGNAFEKVFGEDWDEQLIRNITNGIHDFAQALASTVESGVFDYETQNSIRWIITSVEQIFWILKKTANVFKYLSVLIGKTVTEALGLTSISKAFAIGWDETGEAVNDNVVEIGKVIYEVLHTINEFITKTLYNDEARNKIEKSFSKIGTILTDLKDIFVSVVKSVTKAMAIISGSVTNFSEDTFNNILSVIKFITENVLKFVSETDRLSSNTRITDIFIGIYDTCKGIVKFLKIAKNIWSFVTGAITSFVNEIKSRLDASGVLEVLKAEIKDLSDAVKSIFDGILGKTKQLNLKSEDTERSFGWITLISDIIIDAVAMLTKIIPLATKLAGKISKFVQSIQLFMTGEEPDGTGEKKKSVVEVLKNAIETIFDTVNGDKVTEGAKKFSGSLFEHVFTGITEALKKLNIDWGKVKRFTLFVGFLVGMTLFDAALYKLFRIVGNFGNIFGGINEFITGIAGTATALQKYVSTMTILDQMKTLALAIAILAGAVWMLAQLPREDLARGVVALGLIATIFGVLMKVLTLSTPLISHTGDTNNSIGTGAFTNASLIRVGSGKFGLAAIILGIAIFITAIVNAINQLSKLSLVDIAKGIVVIIAISALLAGLTVALSLMSKSVQDVYSKDVTNAAGDTEKINKTRANSYFLTLSATIISISLAVLAFTVALTSMATVASKHPEGFEKACLAFIAIMVLFSGFIAVLAGIELISKKKFDVDGISKRLIETSIAMIAIAAAFALLTVPILVLSKLQKAGVNLDSVMLNVVECAGIMIALMGVLSIIGEKTKAKDILKAVGLFAAAAVVINILILPIKALSDLQLAGTDFGTLYFGVIAYLSGIMAIIMILTYFASGIETSAITKASALFIIAAIAVNAILAPLSKLAILQISGADYKSLTGNIITIVGTVALITLALAAMSKAFDSKSLLKASSSLLIVSAAVNIIIRALNSMAAYPDIATLGGIALILVVMGGVLAGLVALTKELGNTNDLYTIAGAMVVMSIALIAIAGALTILNKYATGMSWSTFGQLAAALGIIVVAIAGLGLAAKYIATIIPVMNALTSMITSIALVIISFGLALLLVAKALPIITDNLPRFMDTIVDAANDMEEHIGVFILAALVVMSLAAMITVLLIQFTKNLPGLISALDTFINSIAQMSLRGKAVTTGFVLAIAWGLAEATPEVMETIELSIKAILAHLGAIVGWVVDGLLKLILELLYALAEAIRKNTGPILYAVIDILEAILELVVDAVAITLGQLSNVLVAGIIALGKKIKDPSNSLAYYFEEAFGGLEDSMFESVSGFKEASASGMEEVKKFLFGLNGYDTELNLFGDTDAAKESEKQTGEFFDKLIEGGSKAAKKLGDEFGVTDAVNSLKERLLNGELISGEELSKLVNMDGFDMSSMLDIESLMKQNSDLIDPTTMLNWQDATSGFTDFSTAVVDGNADMEDATVSFTDTAGDATGDYIDELANSNEDAELKLTEGMDKLELVVNNRQDNFKQAGRNLIQALEDGVDEKWAVASEAIKSKFKVLAEEIRDILSGENIYGDITPVINADKPYDYQVAAQAAVNRDATANTNNIKDPFNTDISTNQTQSAAGSMGSLQNAISAGAARIESVVRLANDKIDRVINDNDNFHKSFNAYRKEYKDMSIYMDTGALVGAISDDMADAIAVKTSRASRSGG